MQFDDDSQKYFNKQQAVIEQLSTNNDRLEFENKLLREKVNLLLQKYFGGNKSEKFDINQLSFDGMSVDSLNSMAKAAEEEPLLDSKKPAKKRKKKDCSPRLPENILTEEIIIDPEEVKANRQAYRCIGEERTIELDLITQKFFKRIYIRKKYVSIESNYLPPVIAPMFPRLIEGSIASPGLLTEIILNKYVDHLPLYRQEKIFFERYGIRLSRKTMSDWIDKVSHWFESTYQIMRTELIQNDYLQIDETPIKYLTEHGSKQGYFWIYRDPGGNVIYDWQTSRKHECLESILEDYQGLIHSDGFSAYKSYSHKHPEITFLICFAHARRYFHEALKSHPNAAGWFLNQMAHLYHIEKRLRNQRAGPKLRESVRQSESQMILNRIHKALKIYSSKARPKENLGKAVMYSLNHWKGLEKYVQHGKAEIDNNLVENSVRPTALGKKNWMFIGDKDAGQKSAILYSVLSSCKSYHINTRDYLLDMLTKLPSMKASELKNMTPKNWVKSKKIIVA
jgi:transposase